MPQGFNDDEATFHFEQSAFVGGVATVPDARLISEQQAALMRNCYPARSGRVVKRDGHSFDSTFATLIIPIATRRIVSEDGLHSGTIVWGDDGVVYFADGGLRAIATGFATGHIAHEAWNDRVYFSDGANGLWEVYRLEAAEKAIITIEPMADEQSWIVAEAKTAGRAGDDISITLAVAGLNTALSVSVADTDITVHVATGAGGAPTSTAAQVVAALAGYGASNALCTFGYPAGKAGTHTVVATAQTFLVAGWDIGDYGCALVTSDHSFTYLARRMGSERLFGIDAADTTNVRWCDAYTPETWNSLSVASPGGAFVALAEINESFGMWTEEMLYRIDGSDPTTWNVSPVQSDGLGCRAPDTLLVIEGVAVYWSARGLAVYDGTRPKVLSQDIFDPAAPTRSLPPVDSTLWDRMFALSTGDHYILYYPSAGCASGCDRAVLRDFDMGAWGGDWTFPTDYVVTCGHADLRADVTHPYLGWANLGVDGVGGLIYQDPTATDDLGEPIAEVLDSRTLDGARPLMDKIYNDSRFGIYAPVEAEVTVGMMFEDETEFRPGASVTLTLAAGDHMVRLRIKNARARMGRLVVMSSAASRIEAYGAGCDLFFCRAR